MACGPHLRTWLNGVPCADLIDAMELEGFIALQVHAGKAGQIRFKNVRLKDLGQSTMTPLWDGKTLAGWTPQGFGAAWRDEEGVIHGTQSSTQQQGSLLRCDRPNADFALRLKFKEKKGTFGVTLVSDAPIWQPIIVQPAKSSPPAAKKSAPKSVEPKDGWNQLDAIALEGRIVVQLNGLTITSIHRRPGRQAGPRRDSCSPENRRATSLSKTSRCLPLDDGRCR